MKKELFVQAIEALEKQYSLDQKKAELFAQIFPDASQCDLVPDNNFLSGALIHVLQAAMNDQSSFDYDSNCIYNPSWIEYFCSDLDFGKNYKKLTATIHGQTIPLGNAGELYDFLKKFSASAGEFAILPKNKYERLITALKGVRNSMNVHPDCIEESEFADMVRRCDESIEECGF